MKFEAYWIIMTINDNSNGVKRKKFIQTIKVSFSCVFFILCRWKHTYQLCSKSNLGQETELWFNVFHFLHACCVYSYNIILLFIIIYDRRPARCIGNFMIHRSVGDFWAVSPPMEPAILMRYCVWLQLKSFTYLSSRWVRHPLNWNWTLYMAKLF